MITPAEDLTDDQAFRAVIDFSCEISGLSLAEFTRHLSGDYTTADAQAADDLYRTSLRVVANRHLPELRAEDNAGALGIRQANTRHLTTRLSTRIANLRHSKPGERTHAGPFIDPRHTADPRR